MIRLNALLALAAAGALCAALWAVPAAAETTGSTGEEPSPAPPPATEPSEGGAADGAVPDVSGIWKFEGAGRQAKLILDQSGTTLSGHFESGDGGTSWAVEGSVDAAGRIAMMRQIPIGELTETPDAALRAAIEAHGVPGRPNYLRGAVTLQLADDHRSLGGTYVRVSVSYHTDTGEAVSVEEVPTPLTLVRDDTMPELEIVSFEITAKQNAEGRWYWDAPAVIRNAGADMSQRVAFKLEALDRWDEGEEPQWRGVAYSNGSHPPLAAGEETTVHWRTDTPTDTANRPNLVHGVHRAVRLVIDPDQEVVEGIETNNTKTLWRLSCEPEVTNDTPHAKIVWVESETGSLQPDPGAYDTLVDAMPDKGQAVLCYIKLEAQRRAKQSGMTTAGTPFLRNLVQHFMGDYFAAPSADAGAAVIEELGEGQGFPGVYLGAYMWVPKGLRDRYPDYHGDWAWLYPATQFWNIRIRGSVSKGDNVDKIPLVDVPFLVGDRNENVDPDSDFISGGKNLSQSMHWATGVKYHGLPKNAYRELFIGYEYWHMEGFDVFGEDAINDLIAEEMGRMLGRRLSRGLIRNEADLVRAMDADFREARAWVGAMLRLRRDKFDELILQREAPKTHMWMSKRERVQPWGAQTIRQMLDAKSAGEVIRTNQVEQLVQIYTLIYEVDEWERRHGAVGLTDAMRRIVNDEYNDQFRAAPKGFGAEWNWNP